MTTLSRAKPRTYEAGGSNGLPVAAATRIYEGAAVGLTSSGYARPLTSADTFAGFARATADNSAGAAAAINVDLVSQGSIRLAVTSAAITDVGQPVYATDDDTFTLSAGGGVYVGDVKRFVSSGIVVVAFDAMESMSGEPAVGFVYDTSGNVVGLAGDDGATLRLGVAHGNTYVLLGDSIMYNHGGPGVGTAANLYDKGFWTWANAALSGKMKCTRNAGIASNTTTQMLARLETDVLPYPARFCMFMGGVNDPGNSISYATTVSNLQAIVAKLLGWGYIVVWHTPTPYAPDSTTAAKISQIADYVRKAASSTRGCILVDAYAAMINKTATTGAMVSTYSNDATPLHPNALGARAIAATCVTAVTDYVGASSPITAFSQANTVANFTATYATQVLPNPLLVNNGGTITGTNVTSAGAGGLAGAPSGFTVRGGTSGSFSDGTTSATCQLVARSDGFGNDVQLVVSAGASAGTPIIEVLSADYSANISAGQTIYGEWTISMSSAANVKKVVLYVSITDADGGRTMTALTNDGADFSQSDFSEYVFRTSDIVVGASPSALRLRAEIYGIDKNMAGTFKLGKMAVVIAQ